MRNRPTIGVAVAVVAGLLLFGCESPFEPVDDHAEFASGKATTNTTTTILDFSQDAFVECADNGAGETVELSGELHVTVHTVITPKGRVHLRSSLRARGVRGNGHSTGTTYQFSSGSMESVHFDADGTPFNQTTTNSFQVTGPGPDNNLRVHHNTQFKMNRKGEVAVDFSKLRTECS